VQRGVPLGPVRILDECLNVRQRVSTLRVEISRDFGPQRHARQPLVVVVSLLRFALQRKYQVRIGDQNLARTIIRSINNIADFITKEQSISMHKSKY